MFNTQNYNYIAIASYLITPPTPSVPTFSVTYGSQELHDGLSIFSRVRYMRIKQVSSEKQQYLNEGTMYDIKEGQKIIEIEGIIKETTRSALLAKIDIIKSEVLKPNQYLVILDGTQERMAKCVCDDIEFEEDPYNVCRTGFTAKFTTFDYMMDTTMETISQNGIATNTNINIARVGSAEARQTTTLTMTSGFLDSVMITIDTIPITINSLVSGDVLVIDGYEKTVKKNGTAIGFSGIIPKIKEQSSIVGLSNTGGPYTYNIQIQYYPSYK